MLHLSLPKSIEVKDDVVGAALTGAAPTTSEWSTILSPTKLHHILEVQYSFV